jgi:type 1 glutamine amidotransferase
LRLNPVAESQRHALVLSGGWPGHRPHELAERCCTFLRGTGFRVDALPESLEPLSDRERLAGIDLIVLLWTMAELSDEQESGLVDCVASGAGFAGLHGSADAFRARPRYQWLVGGQFVAHPDGITDYTVEIADPTHPITEGLTSFAVRSEQYYLHVDPSNDVLASTTFQTTSAPWINGTRMPVAWTRRFGQGRIFYLSLGHEPSDIDIPEARAILERGLLWAARGS